MGSRGRMPSPISLEQAPQTGASSNCGHIHLQKLRRAQVSKYSIWRVAPPCDLHDWVAGMAPSWATTRFSFSLLMKAITLLAVRPVRPIVTA
jgi:hypothetical protein